MFSRVANLHGVYIEALRIFPFSFHGRDMAEVYPSNSSVARQPERAETDESSREPCTASHGTDAVAADRK